MNTCSKPNRLRKSQWDICHAPKRPKVSKGEVSSKLKDQDLTPHWKKSSEYWRNLQTDVTQAEDSLFGDRPCESASAYALPPITLPSISHDKCFEMRSSNHNSAHRWDTPRTPRCKILLGFATIANQSHDRPASIVRHILREKTTAYIHSMKAQTSHHTPKTPLQHGPETDQTLSPEVSQ